MADTICAMFPHYWRHIGEVSFMFLRRFSKFTKRLNRLASESTKRVVEKHLRSFGSDVEIYGNGYNFIFKKADGKVRDATHVFEGKGDIYLDVAHFNKLGSKLIGEYIRSALE